MKHLGHEIDAQGFSYPELKGFDQKLRDGFQLARRAGDGDGVCDGVWDVESTMDNIFRKATKAIREEVGDFRGFVRLTPKFEAESEAERYLCFRIMRSAHKRKGCLLRDRERAERRLERAASPEAAAIRRVANEKVGEMERQREEHERAAREKEERMLRIASERNAKIREEAKQHTDPSNSISRRAHERMMLRARSKARKSVIEEARKCPPTI